MPLLERESALETLGGWFAEARAGGGRLVLVGGEAGLGKTALVEEFALRQRQAARVLFGACDPLTTPRPLGLLADVAPALGGRLDQLVHDEAPREALFPAVLERLNDARVVTVLVIEDVHWADEATLDLLRFLARRIGATPTLVLVTYRDDEGGPQHPVQLLAGDEAIPATVGGCGAGPGGPAVPAGQAGPGRRRGGGPAGRDLAAGRDGRGPTRAGGRVRGRWNAPGPGRRRRLPARAGAPGRGAEAWSRSPG
jgi:hypothetical protein